ncbi:MAG: HlyD family efflux transporter periplasmic adaptor subunit [Acidobacteriota bacterium]
MNTQRRLSCCVMLGASLLAPLSIARADSLTVTRAPFRKTLLLSGKISSASGDVFVVPQTPSWRLAIKWLETEGAAVNPGDPVVRFDTGTLQTDITSAEIDLNEKLQDDALKDAEARAKALDLKLLYEKARIELEKATLDAKVPADVRPAREFEDKQLAFAKAKSAEETARKALETHDATTISDNKQREIDIQLVQERLERAQLALDSMELRATRSGVFVYGSNPQTDRKVQVGDTVFVGWPVATIPDPSALEVEAFAGEAEVKFLQPGQRAVLVLDAYPQTPMQGQVKRVAGSSEPVKDWGKAAYYRVTLSFDKLDQELMRPGMSVRSEVIVQEIGDAMLVPLAAVSRSKDGLYVVANGKQAQIKPLAFDSFHAVIDDSSDLSVGDVLDAASISVSR